MAISGFESDGKEGVLYRKWMKELNEEAVELAARIAQNFVELGA